MKNPNCQVLFKRELTVREVRLVQCRTQIKISWFVELKGAKIEKGAGWQKHFYWIAAFLAWMAGKA